MDWQVIINLVGGAVLAVTGWFLRTMWDATQKLKDDIHQIEVDLPMHYVRKDDFVVAMEKLEIALNRIFDKLDGKADKE